jgi:hypothetical protein
MGEKWPVNFACGSYFHVNRRGLFTCCKSVTWDRRLYFPSKGRHAVDFFAQKIRRLQPAILGNRGQLHFLLKCIVQMFKWLFTLYIPPAFLEACCVACSTSHSLSHENTAYSKPGLHKMWPVVHAKEGCLLHTLFLLVAQTLIVIKTLMLIYISGSNTNVNIRIWQCNHRCWNLWMKHA